MDTITIYPNYWYPFVSAALGYPFWWSIGPYYGWNYYRNYYPYSEYYYGSDYGYQPTTYISTTVCAWSSPIRRITSKRLRRARNKQH